MATLDRTETTGELGFIRRLIARLRKPVPKFKLHSTVVMKEYKAIGMPAGTKVNIVDGPYTGKDGSISYGIELPRPLPDGFTGDPYFEVVPEEYLDAS